MSADSESGTPTRSTSGPPTALTRRPTTEAAEEILGGYFPVLDHGFVSLIDYLGSDESVERAARVSYGYGTRQTSATRGLIRYLRRHRHTTPSEMVEVVLHCSMPMFVARQWIRHRTASVNEYSARYSLLPLLFYTPSSSEFGLQSSSNRQGRADDAVSEELYRESLDRWDRTRQQSSENYGWMIEEDVAREIARIDLPLSTYTQWYWKTDLHNLLHFLTLRVDPHAQWEIQEYGRVIAGMVKRLAPVSYEAWIDYQVGGDVMSRSELDALKLMVQPGAEGAGLQSGEKSMLDPDELKALGLSPREAREFVAKFEPKPVPEFDLDLSVMRTAEEVRIEMESAVPSASRGKASDGHA